MKVKEKINQLTEEEFIELIEINTKNANKEIFDKLAGTNLEEVISNLPKDYLHKAYNDAVDSIGADMNVDLLIVGDMTIDGNYNIYAINSEHTKVNIKTLRFEEFIEAELNDDEDDELFGVILASYFRMFEVVDPFEKIFEKYVQDMFGEDFNLEESKEFSKEQLENYIQECDKKRLSHLKVINMGKFKIKNICITGKTIEDLPLYETDGEQAWIYQILQKETELGVKNKEIFLRRDDFYKLTKEHYCKFMSKEITDNLIITGFDDLKLNDSKVFIGSKTSYLKHSEEIEEQYNTMLKNDLDDKQFLKTKYGLMIKAGFGEGIYHILEYRDTDGDLLAIRITFF